MALDGSVKKEESSNVFSELWVAKADNLYRTRNRIIPLHEWYGERRGNGRKPVSE